MEFYSDVPYGDFYDYSYNYDLPTAPSGIESVMGTVLMGIMVFYLVLLLGGCIIALINYILKGIGMYTIAKREGRDYPWLAFVPFARVYLQGELSGTVVLKKRKIRNPGIWMIVLPFIAGAVATALYIVFWISIGLKTFLYFESSYQSGFGSLAGFGVLLIAALLIFAVYGAVYKVLRILVNRQIYEKFTSPNMAVAHAVLGVLLPLYESICMFVMRSKPYNPGKEPDLGTPFMTARDMVAPVSPKEGNVPSDTVEGSFRKVQDEPVAGEFRSVQDEPVAGEYRPVKDQPSGEHHSLETGSDEETEFPKPEHEQVEGNYTYETTEINEPKEKELHEEE